MRENSLNADIVFKVGGHPQILIFLYRNIQGRGQGIKIALLFFWNCGNALPPPLCSHIANFGRQVEFAFLGRFVTFLVSVHGQV